VPAALKRVRLDHLAERFPDAMSGGQKQRVGLARAMVIEPDLLLMDEPLSNLDAKLRIEMRQEIRLMQRELGITTIYVTHDQEEALAISDRIAVMERGRILQIGPPRAIFERPAHAFVADFVGGANWFDGQLANGVVTLAAGPRFAAGSTSGAVRVALRTEELRLAQPTDDPAQCFAGRVAMLAYLGCRTRVTLTTPGGEVQADIPSDAPLPSEGGEARLAFDPRRAACFSAETGARLA
jgi:ABC-type Fe3+/spermidine/putrescine transport system ATPase subunit